MIKMILAVFCLPLTATGACADTEILSKTIDDGRKVLTILIMGELSQEDEFKVYESETLAKQADVKNLLIASPGGDVEVAMRIGRFIRENEFSVVLLPEAPCNSACVLILAAGVDRHVGSGSVGIHRPYFLFSNIANPAEEIKALHGRLVEYLNEMNVPTSLADEMFAIEPIDMRYLSAREIQFYRLNSMDFAYRENLSLRNAARLGISRQAYEAFMRDLELTCQVYATDVKKWGICMSEVGRRYGIERP